MTTEKAKRMCKKADCPITKTAGLLSDVWTILIIRHLITGAKRFSELEEELTGISTRTLTLKLNSLIADTLVKKIGIRYALSKQGEKLNDIFDAMHAYGEKYR